MWYPAHPDKLYHIPHSVPTSFLIAIDFRWGSKLWKWVHNLRALGRSALGLKNFGLWNADRPTIVYIYIVIIFCIMLRRFDRLFGKSPDSPDGQSDPGFRALIAKQKRGWERKRKWRIKERGREMVFTNSTIILRFYKLIKAKRLNLVFKPRGMSVAILLVVIHVVISIRVCVVGFQYLKVCLHV